MTKPKTIFTKNQKYITKPTYKEHDTEIFNVLVVLLTCVEVKEGEN